MAAGALGEAPTNMTFYRLLASRSCGWLIRRIMSRSDFLTRWRRAHGTGYDPSAEWLSEIVSQFRDRGTEMTRLALAVRTSYGEQFDDLAGRLDNIDNKTLLIWGADDRLVPLSTGQRFRTLLRDSELVVLPGVGDFPHEERPVEVANLIKRFLARGARSSLSARAANATRQDDHLGTPSVPQRVIRRRVVSSEGSETDMREANHQTGHKAAALAGLHAEIATQSAAIEQQVIAWRRDIHQHPELGNREYRNRRARRLGASRAGDGGCRRHWWHRRIGYSSGRRARQDSGLAR